MLLRCEYLGGKPECARKLNEVGLVFFVKTTHHRPITIHGERFEYEHLGSDPKGGELCLDRVKPRETLVEARSGSNVQIDRQIWAKGRKTNRTT